MANIVYLKAFSNIITKSENHSILNLPLESYITYYVYQYCEPKNLTLTFIVSKLKESKEFVSVPIGNKVFNFAEQNEIAWQVSSCLYPVLIHEDTVITGLCGVARYICKLRSSPMCSQEHEEGLLGFRKSCLQAPNEVSIWTKFCEVDLINTVRDLLNCDNKLKEVPKDLVRFENHLSKPVRVHNVYKVARDLKKESLVKDLNNETISIRDRPECESIRTCKSRKWKSMVKKDIDIDCSVGIENLSICHQFAEGPFLTLADLIILSSYHILLQRFNENILKALLPLTYDWYDNIRSIPEISRLSVPVIKHQNNELKHVTVPNTENVSLYKCDPKRHNPKKRIFTKDEDIEQALSMLSDGMEIIVSDNNFEYGINWDDIPSGANPTAGHLPDERMGRKSQQLENLALAVIKIAKEGDKIVDFCSGSGHLGILIAYLLPNCTVILLENKEQSLMRARNRVQQMALTNVYFLQCNLDFFVGHFDIGVALHACGVASDLVLDKCLKVNAKFVICPCCYGSLHVTDKLSYPRSTKFNIVPVEQYMCIGHASDQTHDDHPLTARGTRCMVAIDSDRAHLAEESGYKVTLSRLKPPSCTPKNNLLIGVPV